EAPRPLSQRGLINLNAFARLYGLVRFFHPSDEAAAADWNALALAGVQRVETARSSNELAASLRLVFGPVAPSLDIYVTSRPAGRELPTRPAEAVSAIRWHHVG